mmetsp:Transcript_6579/g.11912  ORF Transcript_6579/g.11912 Transcript_6579/m.11912 type:complete len:244 (+) Transcript_6579:207-938(+)
MVQRVSHVAYPKALVQLQLQGLCLVASSCRMAELPSRLFKGCGVRLAKIDYLATKSFVVRCQEPPEVGLPAAGPDDPVVRIRADHRQGPLDGRSEDGPVEAVVACLLVVAGVLGCSAGKSTLHARDEDKVSLLDGVGQSVVFQTIEEVAQTPGLSLRPGDPKHPLAKLALSGQVAEDQLPRRHHTGEVVRVETDARQLLSLPVRTACVVGEDDTRFPRLLHLGHALWRARIGLAAIMKDAVLV